MKSSCLIICLVAFLSLQLNANSKSKEILLQLNKYWETVPVQNNDLPKLESYSEIELIQFHLNFVIDSLRETDIKHLPISVRKEREKLLTSLSIYSASGVFPINSYHPIRTPYFIDKFKTPCAVGHLIIESGHEELAQKISRESNYSFIEEMDYPELHLWANRYGFSINELKWIQPSYGPRCLPGQVIMPTCANNPQFNTGCFNPDWQMDGLIAPVIYLTEFNNGSGWQIDSLNSWQSFGAIPGQYRITVTDALNSRIVYNYNIVAPPAIIINDSIIQHSITASSCDGKIKVTPFFGTPPYQFQLMNASLPFGKVNSSGIFDSLCPAVYTILVRDVNFCQSSSSIQVFFGTGINENAVSNTITIRNPIHENRIQLRTNLFGKKTIRLLDIKGKVILQTTFSTDEFNSFVEVNNGIYILEVSNADERLQKKIIISK